MVDTMPEHNLLRLSAEIVSAHAGRNTVPASGLPDLIRTVYAALSEAGAPKPLHAAPLEPAVPIKKSVFSGYIVCLEDGRKLKMLKRHLQSSFGLTPDQYRARWHLPASYPMVAPDYAAQRSGLARQIGLGRKAAAAEPEAETPVQKVVLGTRGRKPKAKKVQEGAAEAATAESS